jgi:hypothetical protein
MLEHRWPGSMLPAAPALCALFNVEYHGRLAPLLRIPSTYVKLRPILLSAELDGTGVGSAGGRNGQGRLEVGGGAMGRIDIIAHRTSASGFRTRVSDSRSLKVS